MNGARVHCAGGFDAVVAAMTQHVENHEVQWAACIALIVLTFDEVTKNSAGATGALGAVASAMRSHPGSTDVLKAAYTAGGTKVV